MLFIKKAAAILTMKGGIGIQKDSSILIDRSTIKYVGKTDAAYPKAEIIDGRGLLVAPGFVDCHTHLVFAGSREGEFAMRIAGKDYETISREGGGIFSTVLETRRASADELLQSARQRLDQFVRTGTTTVEIKSGYGLSRNEEIKMLRVIKQLRETSAVDIVPTYLVHAVPPQMKARDYVDLVTEEIIPEVAREKLAVFCDIFCDKTAFSKKESAVVLRRARAFDLKLKIHADELSNSGGAHLAAELGCVSADHLIFTTASAIGKMKKAGVVPVLLPGTSFNLQTKNKPRISQFLCNNLPLAIGSDYNPGTCMISSMPIIMSIGCLVYGLTIEKAFEAATANGAAALGLAGRVGSIAPGCQADLVVFDTDDYRKIPYQFGENLVKLVIKKGKIIYGKNN